MSFGFSDITKGLSDVVNLGTAAYGLYQGFQGPDESKQLRLNREFLEAAADPTSPRFRNLVALFEEENRRRSADAIRRTMMQSARARARGDVGFGINPERRDESRYRAAAMANQLAGERARQEARQTLLGAGRGFATGVGQGVEDAQFAARLGATSGVGGFAEALARALEPLGRAASTTGARPQTPGTGGAADPSPYAIGTPGGPIGRRPTVTY